jgi:hypothetical protein
MALHNIGDNVRLKGTLADASAVNVDPSTVTVKVKQPDDTITTHTYAATVSKQATGIYYVDFTPTLEGIHYVRFSSTGTGQAAGEISFRVESSEFD